MKTTHKTKLLALASVLGISSAASGQITFLFENSGTTIGSALSGQSTGSFTVGGIEITVTADLPSFNSTASGFGINQAASDDDTDGFDFEETDGPGLAEGFSLSFDQDVYLNSFDVSSWNAGNDEVAITDGATSVASILSTGSTNLSNYLLSSTSTLNVDTVAGVYGNGWSLDSITVTAVPEPQFYGALVGLLALGLTLCVRRRKAAA